MQTNDIIAAIATAVGEAGIAVIRVSGQGSIALVNSLFKGPDLRSKASHTIHYGILHRNGVRIDDVLVSLFHAPRSYTGDETVEISCHGGYLITQRVLELILSHGARAAEPGEFTYRAFLNGKLELSQAEAVADIIHAKSSKAVDAARQQLDGQLGDYVRAFRQAIIDAVAMVELELDFVEEDVEFANKEQLRRLLSDLNNDLSHLLATYEAGRLVRDGVKTVFAGKPNAGKSTLLNTLIGQERAIVSEIAGTTRDTIDADWSHEGMLFRLIDTAGIRSTEDVIEAEGVKRSEKALAEADLMVYLHDLNSVWDREEHERVAALRAMQKPLLVVGTKLDTCPNADPHEDIDIAISALSGASIATLKALMKEKALHQKDYDAGSLLITSSRHRDALEKTQTHIVSAIQALDQHITGDFLAIDLRAALHSLGTITGEITTEDLLDSIFSRFCIGK